MRRRGPRFPGYDVNRSNRGRDSSSQFIDRIRGKVGKRDVAPKRGKVGKINNWENAWGNSSKSGKGSKSSGKSGKNSWNAYGE